MSLTRRRCLFLAFGSATAALAGCGGAGPLTGGVTLAPGTRLVMVRHADRDGNESHLSAIGRARAAALPAALDGIALDLILSPGLQRNLDTARPLAKSRGLPITRIPQERPAAQIAALSAGKSAIWIGNKGNLQSIWDELRLAGAAPLDYGDLFIVTADGPGQPAIDRRFWAAK